MKTKEQYYFGSIKEMVDVVGREYLADWVKRRIKAKIKSYAIRIKSKEAKMKEWGAGKQFLRELKFFPIDIKEDISNLIIFDNKVVIISAQQESYGLIIESNELSITLKYVWQVVWQMSKNN